MKMNYKRTLQVETYTQTNTHINYFKKREWQKKEKEIITNLRN